MIGTTPRQPMNDPETHVPATPPGEGPDSTEAWIGLVYHELRRLAAARLAQDGAAQTLQATALVHEAYLRLSRDGTREWHHRGHFFAAAAEAMRRILVENARRKLTRKRGSGAEKVALDPVEIACGEEDDRILAVSDALERLAHEDPRLAELVKLRFFAGLDGEATAAALGLPVRTASRLWAYARAWLHRELRARP